MTAATWSRAKAYAAWFESPLGRAYRQSIRAVLAPWAAKADGLVLDAGCGPILTFADVFPAAARLLALDCSFELALSARARLVAIERAGAVLCGSIDHLPLGDGSASFVLCLNCLEFVADRQAAVREVFRVAAPGATVVFGVMNRTSVWELTRRLRRPFSSKPYYRGRFLTAAELVGELHRAGFAVRDTANAVRFPPLPMPAARWYEVIERSPLRSRGGVVLVRAVKP